MRGLIAGLVAAFFELDAGAQTASPPAAAQPAPVPASQPAPPPAPRAPAARSGRASGALECLIEPSLVVNVGSSVDGVLEQVLVDRGALVRKGQVVARLQSGV